MEEQLEAGQIVQLKSGGPRMTVESIELVPADGDELGGAPDVQIADCAYVDGGGRIRNKSFFRSALTILHWRFRPGDVVVEAAEADGLRYVVVRARPNNDVVLAYESDGAWECTAIDERALRFAPEPGT